MSTNTNEPLEARAMVAAPMSLTDFMVMAGGRQQVCLTCKGKPLTVEVEVNAKSAEALNEQLKVLSARGNHRAYFGFDHDKERTTASAWPKEFYFNENTGGLHARTEPTKPGMEAVEGKALRGFSMIFHVDDVKAKPAQIVCNANAGLNMGGLTNEPAFKENLPLWAKDAAGARTNSSDAESETMEKNQLAALQATVKTLEQDIASLKAKSGTDSAAQSELKAKEAQLESAQRGVELEEMRAKNVELQASEKGRREKDADTAVLAAVKRGAIPAQNNELQAKWKKWCSDSPEMIDALNAMEGSAALAGRVTPAAAEAGRLEAKEGPANVIKALGGLVKKSRLSRGFGAKSAEERADLSRQMATLYAKDVSKNAELLAMPLHAMSDALEAALATDTLGTVSATMVIQRTLELFRINYPVFKMVYTDFSDQPAVLNQNINTRIVSKPAVQTYSATLGADGRPQGWNTASAATTTDVNTKLDEHVGVPIVFDANTLASTIRRLFDEQAPAMAYALAAYFVAKIYALMTAANFNAYAAVNGTKVPVAYATYIKNIGDFARSAAVDLNAIFNPNEVPLHDRALLLNSGYYGQMGRDPSLITFWAAQRDPELITEGELPRMSKFTPIEAPDFPSSNNRVGFAFQKNAIIAISRLPNDYSKVLPGASYGNVTQISDPETGLTVLLVEYVNHTGGFAEMRMETFIGAGKGDNRAGLVITSQ